MRQFYHQKGWSYPEDGTHRSSDVTVALSSAGEQPGYIRLVTMARAPNPRHRAFDLAALNFGSPVPLQLYLALYQSVASCHT